MKVSETGPGLIGPAHGREVDRPTQVGPGATQEPGRGASGQAEIGRVRDAVEAAPAVREDVVAALRQRILSGAYQVDLERLIDRLLGWGR